jgi:hypothetical protein
MRANRLWLVLRREAALGLRQMTLFAQLPQSPAQRQLGFNVLSVGLGKVEELLHRGFPPARRFESSFLF